MPLRKVEFYLKAVDVYRNLSQMGVSRQSANTHIEAGVIAEFNHKIDPRKAINPREFRRALTDLQTLKKGMRAFDASVAALEKVHLSCRTEALGANTIRRLLAEEPTLPRLSTRGVRYSDAAGVDAEKVTPVTSISEILGALRTDLKILEQALDDATAGLRDALPLAEKGEFSAVMLSGRNAFGDKMPKFTQMFSAYQSFYVRTVGVTVTATMQVYPNGYEWLTAGPPPPKQ